MLSRRPWFTLHLHTGYESLCHHCSIYSYVLCSLVSLPTAVTNKYCFLRVDILRVDILRVDILGVDILGVDILGIDTLGVDIQRVDILGRTHEEDLFGHCGQSHSHLYVPCTYLSTYLLLPKECVAIFTLHSWFENTELMTMQTYRHIIM